MRDSTWFSLVAGVVALLIVLVGALAIVYPASGSPQTASRPAASPTVYRNLSIALDSSVGAYGYSSTQLAVPAGVAVVFTITNFDPETAILPSPSYANVVGTVGGSMAMTIGGHTATVTSVAPGDVSHTFTLSNGVYHVNVPIPAASENGAPTAVSFTVVFPTQGTFNWGCAVLCGPGQAMVRDAMYGTLTVS